MNTTQDWTWRAVDAISRTTERTPEEGLRLDRIAAYLADRSDRNYYRESLEAAMTTCDCTEGACQCSCHKPERMAIGYYMSPSDRAAIAYLSEGDAAELRRSHDCAATIDALRRAIFHVESGNGSEATAAAGEAFYRLCSFHKG